MKKLYIIFLVLCFSCKKDDLIIENVITVEPQSQITNYDFPLSFKVSNDAKTLGSSYWKNIGVPGDVMAYLYQRNLIPGNLSVGTQDLAYGDFNLDGFADIFNPPAGHNMYSSGLAFLIWDPKQKIFEHKNLFNDISLETKMFGGNPVKLVSCYLNQDNYVDIVIFDSGMEGLNPQPIEPIRLVLSDGKGGYDLKEIKTNENIQIGLNKQGGDVGDLNGDGILDIFISSGFMNFICWGIKDFPYFDGNNINLYTTDSDNPAWKSIKGYIGYPDCAGSYDVTITDINKDGHNDIIMGNVEIDQRLKILINQGPTASNKSKFIPNTDTDKDNVITLPYFNSRKNAQAIDYVVDDVNSDGKLDVIALLFEGIYGWSVGLYLQQSDGSFTNNADKIIYTMNPDRSRQPWKTGIIYSDFNNDGKKDIYLQSHLVDRGQKPCFEIVNKPVFVKDGNGFKEMNLYETNDYYKKLYIDTIAKMNGK